MLTTVQGVYKDGKIELLEPAPEMAEARVIVTFMPTVRLLNLADRGISPQEAAEMRFRLGGIVEDWEDPAMDAYNALEPR